MTLAPLEIAGLEAVCSKRYARLSEAVDLLRSRGIHHRVPFPKVVVCGDRSAGKSAVLQGLTGIPFPVASSGSIPFPIELVLRKSATSNIYISIVQADSHTTNEKFFLNAFRGTLASFDHLPLMINRAASIIGMNNCGRICTGDVLRIEVSGPDRPNLTVIEVPGLIQAEGSRRDPDEFKPALNLVKAYMGETGSTILVVLSARYQYTHQAILWYAREADPTGSRTLGVITNPETLIPGSLLEQAYVMVARNYAIRLPLGWHVLRNTDTAVGLQDPPTQRDSHETMFFTNSVWVNFPDCNLGIDSLRVKLSMALRQQMSASVFELMTKINAQSLAYLAQLTLSRVVSQEYKMCLLKSSQDFQDIFQRAVKKTYYQDEFFGDAKSTQGFERRIRAVLQTLSIDFKNNFCQNGRLHKIILQKRRAVGKWESRCILVTRNMFLDRIALDADPSQGLNPPEKPSSETVARLFKNETIFWGFIAHDYVEKAWGAALTFVRHLVSYVINPDAVAAIMIEIIEPAMGRILEDLKSRTSSLLNARLEDPIVVFDQPFATRLHKIRQVSKGKEMQSLALYHLGFICTSECSCFTKNSHLTNFLQGLQEQNGLRADRVAASEALNHLDAYYEMVAENTAEAISREVIDVYLLGNLGSLLSPFKVMLMDDETLERIVGGAQNSTRHRADMVDAMMLLRNTANICSEFLGPVASGGEMTDVYKAQDWVSS